MDDWRLMAEGSPADDGRADEPLALLGPGSDAGPVAPGAPIPKVSLSAPRKAEIGERSFAPAEITRAYVSTFSNMFKKLPNSWFLPPRRDS